MRKATWTDRTAAVKKAVREVLKGFDVAQVCESVVQECVHGAEWMTTRQFDSFVADVTREVETRHFYRNI